MAKLDFEDMVESAKEGFGIAIAKTLTERILSNFVGNANVVSGVAKLLISGFVPSKGLMKYVKVGLVVDAGEDLVYGVLRGFGYGNNEVNVI